MMRLSGSANATTKEPVVKGVLSRAGSFRSGSSMKLRNDGGGRAGGGGAAELASPTESNGSFFSLESSSTSPPHGGKGAGGGVQHPQRPLKVDDDDPRHRHADDRSKDDFAPMARTNTDDATYSWNTLGAQPVGQHYVDGHAVVDEAGLRARSSPQWTRTGVVEHMEHMPIMTVRAVALTFIFAGLAFYAEGFYTEIPGDVTVKIPTISHLGGWGVAQFIFTGGLHITSYMLGLTAWCVRGSLRLRMELYYSIYRDSEEPFVRVSNGVNLVRLAHRDSELTSITLSYWVALTSSFFLFMTASFPMTWWGELHNAFAAAFFFTSLFYMKMINNILNGYGKEVFLIQLQDYFILSRKKWTLRSSVFFALLFLVVMPIIEVSMTSMECTPFAGTHFCALESVRSIFEWMACFSMFAWFYSLHYDIRRCRMLLLGIK